MVRGELRLSFLVAFVSGVAIVNVCIAFILGVLSDIKKVSFSTE
jgi:hypothetical protein